MYDLLSVVIPTHNRADLLFRAIESVYVSGTRCVEVVVVDDCSSDNTGEQVRRHWADVRYIRLQTNMGPGPARNVGLTVATRPWVLMLDDDDVLLPDALETVAAIACSTGEWAQYPCVQFATSSGQLASGFQIVRLRDYMDRSIRGDFSPIINREVFQAMSLQYPRSRVGAEHLLWYRIASEIGIPTWSRVTTSLMGSDARSRLCSIQSQLARPAEYAAAIEDTLKQFGPVIRQMSKKLYNKKVIGEAVYWALAGDTIQSRSTIQRYAIDTQHINRGTGTLLGGLLTAIPTAVLRAAFFAYRAHFAHTTSN